MCSRNASVLAPHVDQAIEALVRERPQLFDTRDEAAPIGTGNFRVLDAEAYLDEVVARLLKAGLCAQRDLAREQIQLKVSDAFSEDFDILLSSGHIWRGPASYRRTCTPAAFPLDPGTEPPPVAGVCRPPLPPAVHHFWVHELGRYPSFSLLDSTPVVGPDAKYCASQGATDGRLFCAVRPEGHPERLACENMLVGAAEDNGRPGPTWRHLSGGHGYCSGPSSGCENHPDNQYLLIAYRSQRYLVCAENGACGEIDLQR